MAGHAGDGYDGDGSTGPPRPLSTPPSLTSRRAGAPSLPPMTSISSSAHPTGWPSHPTVSSDPTTPTFAEAAASIRRSLSVQHLETLRNMKTDEVVQQVSRRIWRSEDEAWGLPNDWERLAVHVFKGGLRAFLLAYGLRGGLNVILALFRLLRTKRLKTAPLLLIRAWLNTDNLRFGTMFAVFAILYKAVLNSLRLLTPYPSWSSSVSLSNTSSFDTCPGDGGVHRGVPPSESEPALPTVAPTLDEGTRKHKGKVGSKRRRYRDPRSRSWHAYVAGAVSALGILAEKKERRITLAQQLFVRGLQGAYNGLHSRKVLHVPHGDVLVFGIMCGQIMYAFLMAHDSIPRSYWDWILNASKTTPTALNVHETLVRTNQADPALLLPLFPDSVSPDEVSSFISSPRAFEKNRINRHGITPYNSSRLARLYDRLTKGELERVQPFAPCSTVHPWEDSCVKEEFIRFFEVVRWILPVYTGLHFIPMLVLRRKAFLKNPRSMLLKALVGSVRSSSFLGVFVVIFQTLFCLRANAHGLLMRDPALAARTPQFVKDFLTSRGFHWVLGMMTMFSLFVEEKKRRAELAMYVMPKGMESMWSIARRRAWIPFVPGGEVLLTAAGMSMVMGTYHQDPSHLSGLIQRLVFQFIGNN